MQAGNPLRHAMIGVLTTIAVGANAWGAAFGLLEQNASGLGNAYAGAAAVAEDASTIFFNSAGLTQIKRPSLSLSGINVNIQSHFENSGSVAALGQSLGGTGGNAGGATVVPALYVAVPLTDKVTGGIGVNAPFGLKTEYDSSWMGRFQAIKSDVKTTNINTALAFKLTDKVSLGVGLDYQSLDATLTNGVNYTAAVAQYIGGLYAGGSITLAQYQALYAANTDLQGVATVKGNDSTWGYDLGLLFTPSDSTKVGLSYRSATKYSINGTASFTAPTASNSTGAAVIAGARASTLADGPVSLEIKLPATTRLAISQKLGSAVELLGEVSWTQWSSIPELRIKRPSGTTLSNTVENWDNTLRYAVGANWLVTDAIKLRVGAALDNAPVPDATRTPRLPDNDRTWLSAGAQFKVSDGVSVDLGYTHIDAKDAAFNQSSQSSTDAAKYGTLIGATKSAINLVGVQATVSF